MLSLPALCQVQSPPGPEPVKTTISVTERLAAESPLTVTEIPRDALHRMPGVNADDRLRLIPGFSLFRRTSSLAANPTTQGVSLRGLGSTGASRTLVLWDGFPLNDPFGGWVYWTRVDPQQLERIEVSRSASTSVFGDRAMGGAVSLFSPAPKPLRLFAGYEGGNRNTHQINGGASTVWRDRFGFGASTRAFTTGGYYIVPVESRGAIDKYANVRFITGIARAEYFDSRQRLAARFDVLAEDRDNGTTLTRNSTSLGTFGANYSRQIRASQFSALGFYNSGEYRSTFSAVSADRNTERLTSLQSVPAQSGGGSLLWQRASAGWGLLAGADLNHAEGWSRERLFPAGSRLGGGTQTQYGLFTQGDGSIGPIRAFGGLRRHVTGSREFWSPSGGLTTDIRNLRLRASAYRAFRAPTLNELYRDFRVGNALTRANSGLLPESLHGYEAGGDLRLRRATLSATAFRSELRDLIANVTLSSTPILITRQRQNVAAARTQGLEASVRGDWRGFLAEAAYLFSDSRFSSGFRVPQVPKHSGSFQLTWSREGTLLSGGLRSTSLQFEDDVNRFLLPGYVVWHAAGKHELKGPFSLHIVVENAANRQYSAGFSPTPLLGAPRLIRAGVSLDLSR